MTGMIVLLYLAIGVGCGVIRLSAVAVGLIAMVPAIVGAYAASSDGALSMLAAALIALLVIEGAYFLTMMALAQVGTTKPAVGETGDPAPGDLRLPAKPQIPEEP